MRHRHSADSNQSRLFDLLYQDLAEAWERTSLPAIAAISMFIKKRLALLWPPSHTHIRRISVFPPAPHPSAFMLPSPAEEALSIQFPIFVRPFYGGALSGSGGLADNRHKYILKMITNHPCASVEAWRSPRGAAWSGRNRFIQPSLSFPKKKNDDGCKKFRGG